MKLTSKERQAQASRKRKLEELLDTEPQAQTKQYRDPLAEGLV